MRQAPVPVKVVCKPAGLLAEDPDWAYVERARQTRAGEAVMTFVWLVIWFVANLIGDPEPLQLDPVNGWVGTLLLAVALDLGRQHTPVRHKHDCRCCEPVKEPAAPAAPAEPAPSAPVA